MNNTKIMFTLKTQTVDNFINYDWKKLKAEVWVLKPQKSEVLKPHLKIKVHLYLTYTGNWSVQCIEHLSNKKIHVIRF